MRTSVLRLFGYSIAVICLLAMILVVGLRLLISYDRQVFEKYAHIQYRNIYSYGEHAKLGVLGIDENNGFLYFEDLGAKAYICDARSEYYCIDGSGFSFSVPRVFQEIKSKWNWRGYSYQLTKDIKPPEPINQITDVVVIRSIGIGDEYPYIHYFYYSPTWGLLGFQDLDQKGTILATRLVRGCAGFGGSKSGSLLGYISDECWSAKKSSY
jgi:hypothetical protein